MRPIRSMLVQGIVLTFLGFIPAQLGAEAGGGPDIVPQADQAAAAGTSQAQAVVGPTPRQ